MNDRVNALSVIQEELPKWWRDPQQKDFRDVVTGLWEVINPIPQSPEEAALTTVFPFMGGMLKYVPWEKARFYLDNLYRHQDYLKERMGKYIDLTGKTGHEAGLVATASEHKLATKGSKGTTDSVELERPNTYIPARAHPQEMEFHTHPEGAYPYLTAPHDLPSNWRSTETIVATPNREFTWLTTPQGFNYRDMYRPEESSLDTLSRIIYGAKKDRWNLQLGFDPRLYGVSK